MAWEISHSPEAWSAFQNGLFHQTDAWLREAIATCEQERQDDLDALFAQACFSLDIDDSNIDADLPTGWAYDKTLAGLSFAVHDSLVDTAYQWAETNNTCSNGGWDFYIDKGGYFSINLAEYEPNEDVDRFRDQLAAGPYAWPGGYPLYFLTSDGGVLSFEAAQEEKHQIIDSIRNGLGDGWNVCSCAINYDDPELICNHSGERIESAYAED